MRRCFSRSTHRRSPAPTRPRLPTVGLGLRAAAVLVTFLVWGGTTGCEDTDIGRCCSVLDARDEGLIPQAEVDANGVYISVMATDPAFDCEELTCLSYAGSRAYCTRECIADSNCPEGFVCAQVIMSQAGPNEPPKSACARLTTDMTPYMCPE